jgi:hypothetical protein
MNMKKKKTKTVEWHNLKVGDFIENDQSVLFCFSNENGNPSCMGRNKPLLWKYNLDRVPTKYKLIKPTKSFVKLCKRLLKLNLTDYRLNNLSYIEALTALKKYD